MKYYIPNLNDEVLFENEELRLPNPKIIQLLTMIYPLDKEYKIEKIIAFNDVSYQDIIKEITSNQTLELVNYPISHQEGYFHITFERIIEKNLNYVYDPYCEYALIFKIDGQIDYQYYQELFNKMMIKR